MSVALIKNAFIGLLIGGAAFKFGTTFSKTDVVSEIDTLFVDRPLEVRDTVNIYQPYQVTVYDTVETTRVDTIRVAENFNYTGLVARSPVTLDKSGFTLTTFDLDRQSFVQQHYDIPTPDWSFGVFSVTELTNQFVRFNLESDIRYKDITLTPLVGLQNASNDLILFYGARLRYQLF